MRAGRYRYLVDFQSHDGTTDAAGQPDYTTGWSNVLANVPARVQPVSGGEPDAGDGLESRTVFEIECRYHDSLSAISSEWRIVTSKYGNLQPESVRRALDDKQPGIEVLMIDAVA